MNRNFYLVVIGQIISLFGNAVMRFAMPLHLLDVTGSAALLGLVSGFSFLPMVIMSPVGGLIADRVNKRNIMVVLDFLTAGIVLTFTLLYGKGNLVTMILVLLFLLYGIAGAYQPSVQASIPLLVAEENVMGANAAINMVSSLSGLLGPALGGIVYGIRGMIPLLYVCVGCFLFSAVMEIFIQIPHQKRERTGSMLREVWEDLKTSVRYIVKDKKEIGRLTICCAAVNLFLSALLIIGLPVVVMQALSFPSGNASEMYGFLQAVMAAGGLAGGIGAGVLGKKLKISDSWKLLFAAAVLLLPMGLVLFEGCPVYAAYAVLALAGFVIMALASLYTIQFLSFIQITTPAELTAKVIAWVLALASCAQPMGQIVYGFLFEKLSGMLWVIFAASGAVSVLVSWWNKNAVKDLGSAEGKIPAQPGA